MLGRHGCKWAYDEMVLIDGVDKAKAIYETFSKELSKLEDLEDMQIELVCQELETCDKAILRLRQTWNSKYNVRFVTDGEKLGINYRLKKIPYKQVFFNETKEN